MPTENRSNDADGWIACDDGLHLIQMDKNLSHYGWVFRKVGGGRPYSVREATPHEMAHAQARQHLRIGVAQITGQAPAPQPHSEPIAWMVGTAFWWTKEEAERDSAATELAVVPVGPMLDTAEFERQRSRADTNALNHRHAKNAIGDVKAYVERLVAASNGQPSVATGYLSDIVAFIVERNKGDPTETSDINALRLELQESRRNQFNACAQLAERDALLDRVVDHAKFWHDHPYAEVVEAIAKDYKALSASAEPQVKS